MAVAKVAVSVLIDQLIRRMRAQTDATTRLSMLAALNRAEQLIGQRYSVSYLQTFATLVIAGSSDTVAAPDDLDESKPIAIEQLDNLGIIPFYPPDEFRGATSDTYGSWEAKPYNGWTKSRVFTGDVSALWFKFASANNSVGTLSLTCRYQRIPGTLTDAANVYSSLPPGYELTILLDRAEADEKRVANTPGWQMLLSKNESDLENFYDAWRVSKETTLADTESRKRSDEKQRKQAGV